MIHITCTDLQLKDTNKKYKSIKKIVWFVYSPRFTRVPVHIPQGARSENGDPAGGGAPKFFLNWLTFAHSPYDADHISAPQGARWSSAGPHVGSQVHGQAFSSASFYIGEMYTVKMREG